MAKNMLSKGELLSMSVVQQDRYQVREYSENCCIKLLWMKQAGKGDILC